MARPRMPLPSGATMGMMLLLVLLAVLLVMQRQFLNFIGPLNLRVLLHKSTVPLIVALGMLLVIISGGIDLSVGAVLALCAVVTVQTYQAVFARTGSMPLASVAALTVGVGTGGLCGLINGLVIAYLQVSPFIATLGMFSMARGLAYWRSDRTALYFNNPPAWVSALGKNSSNWGFFGPGVWSAVVLGVVIWALLRYTVLGRHCYAIGSNEATARLCGVNVKSRKVLIYVLCGLLTGWASVLRLAELSSGDPNSGEGLELIVIASVVIGGASLSGGRGSVPNTLFGVLLLGTLESVLGFLQAPIDVKNVVNGAVLVFYAALGRWERLGSRLPTEPRAE